MQGDTLGGLTFGNGFGAGLDIGNVEATVASALIIEPRGASKR
jgi:hypothetical protein